MKKTTYTPDPLAPWSEKTSDDYALSYAQLIAKEWFDGGPITNDCQYATRRDYIINNRLIARGKHDEKSMKNHMSRQEGDLTYMNLAWDSVNIAGKFCRVVANGINEENYNLDIRANDRLSLINKKKRIDEQRNNMRSLQMLKNVKKTLGINLIPKGFIPQDEEQLMLYSEIKDRPKIEIAEEITIDYINNVNSKKSLENAKNKDLVEIGIAASRMYTDPVNGVMFHYADPEYLVHSHVKRNDFKDAYYYGLIDRITINDLQRESRYDESKLRKIAKSWIGDNSKGVMVDSCDFRELLDIKVTILRYAFKTTKTKVYKIKKKEGRAIKATKKDESYNPPQRSDYGKVEDIKDTWMEGTYIVNSEYVYGHKECENLIRDERNKAISPFNVKATDIYKNELHSFLDDIKTPEREIQFIHLKLQHLTAELKPDLTIINEDALADLSGSGDKKKMWGETLNLLNVKGVVVEKTVDMGEMGTQKAQGARPSSSQQGSALTVLLNNWAHYYNLIRDTTGVNPARDGSLAPDALLGVNQMAQLASNTATHHIVEASIEFNKVHCEAISSRVHNIFKSKAEGAERLREMYRRAVGKQNIDALEAMSNRHLHDFGFTVNMIPSQKELQEFREDLTLSLQDGTIDVEIKHEAQQIAKTNMKLASQYLFYMRKQRRKQMLEDEEKRAKMKSQNDMQAAKAATEGRVQAYSIESEIDLKKEAQMAKIRVFEKQAMLEIARPDEERKFKQEVFLKKLDSATAFGNHKYMEDRKDQRTKIQASQQARMIPERKSDNPKAINFVEEDIFDTIFDR